jgi:E3 ubiquitin-protein ligase RNF216
MAQHEAHPRGVEVIDLVSDDDASGIPQALPAPAPPALPLQQGDDNAFFDALDFADFGWARDLSPQPFNFQPGGVVAQHHDHEPHAPAQVCTARGGSIVVIDGDEVFIPDEEPEVEQEFSDAGDANNLARDEEMALNLAKEDAANESDVAQDHQFALSLEEQEMTADRCLQSVLAIFPDISHEYVIGLYNQFDEEGDYQILPGQARLDNIIEQLVENPSYPKQEKGKRPLKRKREGSTDDNETNKWEQPDRDVVPHYLKASMQAVLKADFPGYSVSFINETLVKEKHLYQAFIALAKAKDESDGTHRPYGRGRPSTKRLADADTIALNCGWPQMMEELTAARLKVQVLRSKKAEELAQKRAEQENLDRAISAGETAECSACFDDLPMNRQIHCNGTVAHFVCFDCAVTYIKSEVGQSRCQVLCTAGCGAGFASNQLNLLSDTDLLQKLAQLQQEKDIRDAGLDDLEECPFCDYKAILPPIDEDFEFRCANPECEKVSCRRCKSISHIPVSCEQHAKDNKINSRHKIEEAMTAALIRSCNKCKKTFIKDYGCNKMSCASCGNTQCYVCSANTKDYNHFDQNAPGARAAASSSATKRCPLYDNVEERHEREVKEAEAAARAQVVEENPDVSAEDLEIKVSDAVKQSTANRAAQFGPRPGAAGEFLLHPGRNFMAFGGGEDDDDDEDEDDDEGGPGDLLPILGLHRRPRAAGNNQQRYARHFMQAAQLRMLQNQQRHLQDRAQQRAQQHQPPAQPRVEPVLPPRQLGYIPVFGFQAPLQQQPPAQPIGHGGPPHPAHARLPMGGYVPPHQPNFANFAFQLGPPPPNPLPAHNNNGPYGLNQAEMQPQHPYNLHNQQPAVNAHLNRAQVVQDARREFENLEELRMRHHQQMRQQHEQRAAGWQPQQQDHATGLEELQRHVRQYHGRQ